MKSKSDAVAFAPVVGAIVLAATFFSYAGNPDETGVSALSRELVQKQSNGDAETFAGYCAALGKFSGKDGNTFTFEPRVYDIDKIFFRKNIDVDTGYVKTAWERNLQVSLGITPNRDYILGNPANCLAGMNYAILNNKEIPRDHFDALTQRFQSFFNAQTYITAVISAMRNDTVRAMLRAIMNQRCYACVPPFIKDSVEEKYGIPFDTLMERPRRLVDSLSNILLRRPQLVAGITALHGLGNRGEAGFDLNVSYASYLITKRKPAIDPQIHVRASFSLRDDSTRTHLNLQREIMEACAGCNVIFFSRFELMPGIACRYILSSAYTDERRTTCRPTGSVSVKIAEKLVTSLSVAYDPNARTFTANAAVKTSLE